MTSTDQHSNTDDSIYFEACDTFHFTNKCCQQILDSPKNDFEKGDVNVFELDDKFLDCWHNLKNHYYFMSVDGNNGWKPQEIKIQLQSTEVCTLGGDKWLDGDDNSARQHLSCTTEN